MSAKEVEAVPLPRSSLAANVFARPDYADAYRVRLPGAGPHSIEAVVQMAFGAAPRWAVALMGLRNRVARVLGLKAPRAGRQLAAGPRVLWPGDQMGIFRVFERRDDELLMGEDDRHLDFRVSVLIERDGADAWAVVSTVVRFNNWLGRAYFLPVRPFHRLLVPAVMRNGLRQAALAAQRSSPRPGGGL